MHVADRLHAAIETTGSVACVGLDPRPALLPEQLRADALDRHGNTETAVAAAFVAFNTAIIDAVAGHCAAVKPQVACYEAYGAAGWSALAETVGHARARGIEVIVDAKRNDIGSTAEHYRQAVFGGAPLLGTGSARGLGGDWVTVNGYLGADSIEPFLDPDAPHGVFVLVRTSNPSAVDLQSESTFERMAALVHGWGASRRGRCGLSAVGAVVGATWPAEARRLRQLMPNTPFLVPGYGAQGGGALDALAGARPEDGGAILVNSSRAIIGAWQSAPEGVDFAEASRVALDAMNDALAAAR